MSAAPALAIEIVTSLDAIAALEAEWRELEAATPEATGFQSYAWCRSWMETRGEAKGEFRIVALREEGRLVMLWPLQVDRRFGARLLRWLGEPMTQYGDALARESASRPLWRAAIEAEIASWRALDLVALTRLRADGVLCGAGLSPSAQSDAVVAPYVDLTDASALRRRHKSAERRERRLAMTTHMELERAETFERRRELAQRALALKRAWLRSKGYLSAGLSARETAAFLDRLAGSDLLEAHALRLGAIVVAVELGFLRGGVYRALLASYDPLFAAGAPGHALTRRLIAHYAETGVEAYDFLAPGDAYKRSFAVGATPLVAHFSPRTALGRLAGFGLAHVRPRVKRAAWTLSGLYRHVRNVARRLAREIQSEGASREPAIGENLPERLRGPSGLAHRPR